MAEEALLNMQDGDFKAQEQAKRIVEACSPAWANWACREDRLDRQTRTECWCSSLGELDCPLSPWYLVGEGFSQVSNSRQELGSGASGLPALGLGCRWESQEAENSDRVGERQGHKGQ